MAFDSDGYPSLDDLLEFAAGEELASFDEAVQLGFRTSSIRTIESYTGQRFAQEGEEDAEVSKIVSGLGSPKLWLPKRLASLLTLGITNSAIDATGCAIGSSSDIPEGMNDYLYVVPTQAMGSWLTRALSDDRSLMIPAGMNNVTVTGIWGWPEADFPDAITQAIVADMEDQAAAARHGLGGSITALRRLGGSDTSEGPLSVTISRSTPVLSSRAMALIEDYGWSSYGALI